MGEFSGVALCFSLSQGEKEQPILTEIKFLYIGRLCAREVSRVRNQIS